MKYKYYYIGSIGECAKLHMRITNGQETVKVLAHFCCNNSISGIESVKKEFIINLDTVYNKPLRYLLKT